MTELEIRLPAYTSYPELPKRIAVTVDLPEGLDIAVGERVMLNYRDSVIAGVLMPKS